MDLDTYEVWENWFRTRCEHNISPAGWEAWNGAVETAVHWMLNNPPNGNSGPQWDEYVAKFRKKLQTG